MAGNDGHGTTKKAMSTSRRTFIRTVGAGAAATGVATASAEGALGAETTVDLDSRGLRKGDLIDPYLEEYFTDGTVVRVPPGEYDYTGTGLGGTYENAALIGAAAGVTFHGPDDPGIESGPSITATEGTVRIENVTVRTAPSQSRWHVGSEAGATAAIYNVDFPRGGDTGPDSLPNRIEIDGTGDTEASASYELAVTGDLSLDEGHTAVGSGEALYLGGDIGDGEVSSHVRNGVDAFFYSGRLDRVEIDGDADISVFQG